MSPLTGKQTASLLEKATKSAIFSHVGECKEISAFPDESDFTILASATYDFHVLIKESLLIRRDKPVLNEAGSSTHLFLF